MSTSFASPAVAAPPRPAVGATRRTRVLIGTDTYPPT